MTELAQKKCVPCEGGVPPLGMKEVQSLLAFLPGWVLIERRIARGFSWKDFVEAMDFTNRVAKVAEEEGHHPDIHIYYNVVRLEIWTHAVDGLTENDFILAAKVNDLL